MPKADSVKLIECPRDAWQGLKGIIPADLKADYVKALISAGFKHIDAVSFVSPKAVPQMADAEDVLKELDPQLAPELFDRAPQIATARLFLDRRCVEVPITPAAASVTRFALDDALWRAAMRAGVDCREQITVQSVRERFLLETSSGEFQAKCVIVAPGRWSNPMSPDRCRKSFRSIPTCASAVFRGLWRKVR